ncbi:MAG: FAD-binding domain-containing protein [Pseudomonadota bacterium]
MTAILWFKRDLRVEDHLPLTKAAEAGAVVPLYIAEPELWRENDASGRQWAFISECLAELQEELAGLGAPLIVRVGDAVEILNALVREVGATKIFSHEETGNGWTYGRDRRVAAWARDAGIVWEEVPAAGVVRRLATRDIWAKTRDQRMAEPVTTAPKAVLGVDGLAFGKVPSASDLGLAPDPCPHRQAGGRGAALSLLGGFLTERGRTYRADMATPVKGEAACSRLSPHLAWGTISGREVMQATIARQREVRGTRDGWVGSLKSFQSRLAWRDHFMQKLEDEPALERECLHRAYENLRPREPDTARLYAWAEGETGLPFVDACMRYLKAGGWLNFRMRSMLMSVASYHLWLDWRATGPVLARYFTDYEPGIHWPQTQMQSGVTGMNTVRIYNPVKQGHDQDPEGGFTRAWVPELAPVPDEFLQEPWRWDGATGFLGARYPAPTVDVAAAAKAAREAVWAVRRGADFRAEAAKVVEKHASRKDRQGRFVNDRATAPRRRKADPAQAELDL